MSKSFTSRPAVMNGRGRGRGTQQNQVNRNTQPFGVQGARANPRPPAVGTSNRVGQATRTTMDSDPTSQQNGEEPEAEQRMTYQGGYSMIAPNQKKRQQITQMAQRETEAYENHIQQKTPKSFSYVGTAGGGAISEAEARQKLTSFSKTQRLLKQHERTSFVKQKEEEELRKKKEEYRKKAIQNEQREKDSAKMKETQWDSKRKRTNEAFLRRLEGKSKQGTPGVQQSAENTSVTQTPTRRLEPESVPPGPIAVGASGYRSQEQRRQHNSTNFDQTSDEVPELYTLSAIFPRYSRSELTDILRQVDFSVDAAIELLQG